jgi:1-acyl-sn-glycerol-3-phosphate acyltransferase
VATKRVRKPGREVAKRDAASLVAPLDPSTIRRVEKLLQPVKGWLSPVALGLDHVPREGPVLLAGNHTIYGVLDVPMLALAVYEATGRVARGVGDHAHFAIPIWRDLLQSLGAFDGNRENCAAMLRAGEMLLIFPGGGREVMKRKGEFYKLLWKERIGFVRLAIETGASIVPFASVGVEHMFEVVGDADDLLRSPVGDLLRATGITRRSWFRKGELIPPITRGRGPASVPRLERQYFLFGEPIPTGSLAGRQDDAETCLAVRRSVQQRVESQIAMLLEVRSKDPDRYPVQRLLRKLASRLG